MSDADKDYDRLSTPLDQLQHHGYVSPSFYNLPHGDKGYDLSDSHQKMGDSTAYLRRITDGDEMYREAGRTSPMAEKATGALGTSPKKPKAKKKVAKKKGGKRKSRRKRKRKSRRRRKRKTRR